MLLQVTSLLLTEGILDLSSQTWELGKGQWSLISKYLSNIYYLPDTVLGTVRTFFFFFLHFPQNIVNVLSCSVMFDSLKPQGLYPARILWLWDFPGKNTGVSYLFLLQGMVPMQGSNPHLLHLLHWQVDSLPPHHLGSPFSIIRGQQDPIGITHPFQSWYPQRAVTSEHSCWLLAL